MYNKGNIHFNSDFMGELAKKKLHIPEIKALAAKIAILTLIIFNLAIFSFLIFKGTGFIWNWSKEKMALSVRNEQKSYQDNLLALVTSIENQTDSLEVEYENLSGQKIIGLKKKKEILEKIEELEKDGLRLTIIFNAYHQDESIKVNPLRDFNIEETFNKSWLLPHKIERLARSLEFGIFRGFITQEQDSIIKTTFSGVRYQIEEIKKTW
ncbi:hypothetical protein KJ761_03055 [Patescibacteria group bacterium]|nr:hypothetical protein [Patescibacteria group bacterium]